MSDGVVTTVAGLDEGLAAARRGARLVLTGRVPREAQPLVERWAEAVVAPTPRQARALVADGLSAGVVAVGDPAACADGAPLPRLHEIESPRVRWEGDRGRPTSLSIVNDRVCERLPWPTDAREPDVVVRHGFPPDFRGVAPGTRLALVQPWEYGALPVDWVEPMRALDALWVPSEHVRAMYRAAGVAPGRVAVVPNGVELDRFRPEGPRLPLPGEGTTRFLFVGGLIGRKGPDVLLSAWLGAFAARDDVTLVVKDFGAGGIYADGERSLLHEHAASGAAPRVVLLDDDLSLDEMAALYRSCDVLVHPYRAEGFGMPVLEAMACGLPVVVTADGPTDEFCPEDACWRIPSQLRVITGGVKGTATAGTPTWLEPSTAKLAAILREVEAAPVERAARGAAARLAAEALGWQAVSDRYATAIRRVWERPPRRPGDALPDLGPRAAHAAVAAPAWAAGAPGLGVLLEEWATVAPSGTDAQLLLVVDGAPETAAHAVMAAAAEHDVDVDACADIALVPLDPAADGSLHAEAALYVPLPGAAPGHLRAARTAGSLEALNATPGRPRAPIPG